MKVRWLHKPLSALPQSSSCLAFYHLIILDQSFISCLNWFIFLMKLLCWREGDICRSLVYYTWDSLALKFTFDIVPHVGQTQVIISGFVFFSVYLITQMFQMFQSQGFLSMWKANGESTGVLSEGTNTQGNTGLYISHRGTISHSHSYFVFIFHSVTSVLFSHLFFVISANKRIPCPSKALGHLPAPQWWSWVQ